MWLRQACLTVFDVCCKLVAGAVVSLPPPYPTNRGFAGRAFCHRLA
jgi:hypothetical protein